MDAEKPLGTSDRHLSPRGEQIIEQCVGTGSSRKETLICVP